MTDVSKEMRIARIVGAAALGFALAAWCPAPVMAQTIPDTAAAARNLGDTAWVRLTPARPKQGSILRISIRPPVSRPLTDTSALARTRADTTAGGAAWTIPRPDSVVPDSLVRPRPDSLSRARADSLARSQPDSARLDTPLADSARGRIFAVRGTLFGEPLHFLAADSGEYVAIGGIPVDAPKTVNVVVIIDRIGGPADTVPVRLEIGRTAYKMEKLTVAPKFGQAPDSALAARIAREQALATEVSRRSHDTPRLWTGAFTRPRASRETSGFGDGREFNGKVQSRHMGLDLAGAVGAPVLAADRGVVALVGEFYLAGNAVYIDHGGGLVTAYFHMSAVNVAKGDTVAAGDTIGKVGATGRVTGPHLHWVARYGAITIDPSTLLELAPARREP
jgi:hypothetical protein